MIGLEDSKADITARAGKRRLVLPMVNKERSTTTRASRLKSSHPKEGDSIELVGVSTIWDAIRETLVIDGPGERDGLNVVC